MTASAPEPEMPCPVCLSFGGAAAGVLTHGRAAPTVVLRCKACGSLWRETSATKDPKAYFGAASYTQDDLEPRWRRRREAMFRFIAAQARGAKYVLDVGASYGHLIEALQADGVRCDAVEPVPTLRQRLRALTQDAFASIDEIPANRKYDAIAAIDSLYYFSDPRHAIFTLSTHLRSNGSLILRVTNRTPFLRAAMFLRQPMSARLFGDQEVAFSKRGLAGLLQEAGLEITHRYLWEHKRLDQWQQRLAYPSLTIASLLPGVNIAPGLFWMAVRR